MGNWSPGTWSETLYFTCKSEVSRSLRKQAFGRKSVNAHTRLDVRLYVIKWGNFFPPQRVTVETKSEAWRHHPGTSCTLNNINTSTPPSPALIRIVKKNKFLNIPYQFQSRDIGVSADKGKYYQIYNIYILYIWCTYTYRRYKKEKKRIFASLFELWHLFSIISQDQKYITTQNISMYQKGREALAPKVFLHDSL